MKYSGMLNQDEHSNFPSAAYEALQKRKMKERADILTKAETSRMGPKRKMLPPKKTLRPRKVL
jgi:hypothetical protein